MASLKERYEELFGPTPAYDPIDITAPDELEGRARRRAIDMQAAAPSASPRRAIPELPAAPVEEQGAITGLLKTGASKVVAEPLVGAAEYGLRMAGGEQAASYLQGVRGDMAQWREGVYARMNPEVMDMVGRELLTLDPDRTIWRGGPLEVAEAVAYKVIEQTPSLLATLIPGAIMMRAGAMGKGISYLGASEAGISLGAIQNEIADGINEMSADELGAESPRFRQLMEEYGDEAQARADLIREAQGMAPLIGGVAVGAISAAAGRYLSPVFDDAVGLGFGQRVGRTAISEGLIQEGPQESVEQIASNISAAVYDGDRDLLEGVAESYAQGALLGAIMGGGVGGILGRSGQEQTPPELDTPDAPSAFTPGRGGPTGRQQALPLDFGEEQRSGPITQQEDMFAIPDELFDEQGNYVGNVAAQAAAAQEEDNLVDPAIRAAIQANIRRDQKMDDMFQTNPQREQEYPSQNIQTEMFPRAAPTGGLPAVPTGPIPAEDSLAPEQQEMFPGPEKRSMGNRQIQGYDFPIPEPEVDISAQMDQLARGMRDGVYLAAEQQVDPAVLGDFPMVQDFDGRGGDMIFKDEATADQWMEVLANSNPEDLQAVLGEITGAGTGKPIDGRLAVQQVNEEGGVARETLVSTLEEAQQVQEEWGGNTRVLTAEEAIARREMMAAGDLFAEPEPEPEGTAGGTPRSTTGRHRVRFTDDAGTTIEDRTFSDLRRANKYADELADTYGLAQPDADARITVTPIRTMPKQKVKPTQDEQKAELAKRKKKAAYKTEGEQVADEIRRRVPMEERSEMVGAVTPAKTREEAAKNLLRLAAKQMDEEQARSIDGFFPPDSYEFKDEQLKQEYTDAWQALYEADFIAKNKAIIPLEFRGTVVSKANRDKKKALKKIEEVREGSKPRRKVEKAIREARYTSEAAVAQLAYNERKIGERLGIEMPTDKQKLEGEILSETQQQVADFGESKVAEDTEEDVYVAAAVEGAAPRVKKDSDEAIGDSLEGPILRFDMKTTKEELQELTDSELNNVFDDALRYRQSTNKRLDDGRISEMKRTITTRSEKIKEILRAVVNMRNKAGTDARAKGAYIVTNVTNTKDGGIKRTTVRSGPLTSASEKYEEGKTKLKDRAEKAKQTYTELSDNLKAALKRLKAVAPETDEYGNLTETGQDQVMGIWWAESMAELGQAVLEKRSTDDNAMTLAKKISVGLKRVAGKNSDRLFGTVFAEAARQTLIINAKGMGKDLATITKQVNSYNDRLEAASRLQEAKKKWAKDSDYKQFIEPIIRKFHESYWNNKGTYYPTLAEATNLKWVLDNYRAQGKKEDFYKPLRRVLEDFGFKFKDNTMVVEEVDGKFDFTPKDAHLLNRFRRGEQIIIDRDVVRRETDKPYEPVTLTYRRPEGELDKRIAEREKRTQKDKFVAKEELDSIKHVRASAIFARFRKIVDNPKSTKDKLIDAELKLLEDLKKEGFLTNVGAQLVTIKVFDRPTITYRRSARALDAGTLSKKEARSRMASIRKSYTKPLYRHESKAGAYAGSVAGTSIGDETIEWLYSTENTDVRYQRMPGFGLRDTNPLPAFDRTADRLHEKIATKGDKINANEALDIIIAGLPKTHFFGKLAQRLRALDMDYSTIEYHWGSEFDRYGWAGRYNNKTKRIQLNFESFNEMWESNDKLASASFVHTFLHELSHAATIETMNRDATAREYVADLQVQARLYYGEKSRAKINKIVSLSRKKFMAYERKRTKALNEGEEGGLRFETDFSEENYQEWVENEVKLANIGEQFVAYARKKGNEYELVYKETFDLPYGLDMGTFRSEDEFVAEAWSNPEFQEYLKTVPFKETNIWAKFKKFFLEMINYPVSEPRFESIWDAFMAVESRLTSPARGGYNKKLWRTGWESDGIWNRYLDEMFDTNDMFSKDVRELSRKDVSSHRQAYNDAGNQLGDLLNDRYRMRSANTVLQSLIDTLPERSALGITARKLAELDLRDVTVRWDFTGYIKNPDTNAVYRGKHRRVVIARKDSMSGMKLARVTLHELMHAATQESLRINRPLRALLTDVQSEVRQQLMQQMSVEKLPYGLRPQDEVDEFVAEMFSNEAMQQAAKATMLDSRMSLWSRFKSLVKQLLGWARDYEISAFDMVMELQPQLFEYAEFDNPNAVDLFHGDTALGSKALEIWNRAKMTYDIENRARDAATAGGTIFGRGKLSHAFHSMRQLRERYEQYFGGKEGPLAKYMDAFNSRNYMNNELMQMPERLSRKWSEFEQKHGVEAANEFSAIATEATMHTLDPSKVADHERNKKSAKAQPTKYRELRARYQAMPQDYKDLWTEVTDYYQASLEQETGLMMLNAVRGVVTKGAGETMDINTFNRKYNESNILKFSTQEDILAEFGEFLGEDAKNLAKFIQRVANVPAMKQGVYFPLMRYGEYAVYAKTTRDKKYFKDSQAARKYAADQRLEDPTYSVNTREESDGRWSVQVTESAFVMGETVTEVMEKRQQLVDEGYEWVGDVGRKLEMPRESAITSNAALSSILETLSDNAAAQNAIKQFYLQSLSDQSFRKREIKRQNRRGVDYFTQHRNFANYARQSAYYRAQLKYGWQMAKGLSDMREYLKDYQQGASKMSRIQLDNVYETLKTRDDKMTDPVQLHKAVRGGIALTQFYMLTSASYHMINSTQPWMVSLPTMGGRHGWGQAFAAMKGAQALIKDPIFGQIKESKGGLALLKKGNVAAERAFGVFDQLRDSLKANDARADEHLAMLDRLRKTSVLEVSPLTELREIATGKESWTTKAMDASRAMAHMVEVNNRVLTAIAAYDLEYARQKNGGAGEEAAREAATQYAEDMVSQTQFDYSTANKPPAFLRFPIVFQFMQWSQHIYAHIIRNTAAALKGDKDAAKILGGILGTHAAVAGALGVTLQPIKMAFGLAMMALGDDDEPYTLQNALSGTTFDRVITSGTNDLFGTTISTVLSKGLPAGLGIDLSTRMSLGTLFFIDLRGDTPESVAGSLLSSFGGASVNQALTFGRGIQYMGSGDIMKGLEAFSPKFMRDILRAGRFASEGLVNNSGDTVIDTSRLGFYETALQAVGFTPTKIGQFYEGQAAIKDKEAYVRKQKIRLMKDFRTSGVAGRRAIMEQIIEFNNSFPQEAITRSALLRNMKGKLERELQYERYGAAIDDKKASLYAGYGEPYR